jgi:hypothetical protein
MEDNFDWLQKWYESQCDGDWEHEYGIKIETVDNPGWYVVINLIGTECEDHIFSPVEFEINEKDWYFCLIRDSNFVASCGSCNLSKVLQIFRSWAEKCKEEKIH